MAALGHEALSVAEAGLAGSDDDALYETAVEQECVIVTENFADFATITNNRLATGAPCVPVVFVQKRQHPRGALLRGGLGGRRWPLLRGPPVSANLGSDYRQILDICSGNYWIMFSATVGFCHGYITGAGVRGACEVPNG